MSESIQSLILASASRTRAELLRSSGIAFVQVAPEVDEDIVKRLAYRDDSEIKTADIALLLAQTKAVTVSERHTEALVIGADQTLLFGDKLFDKPHSLAEAREQLLKLRGTTHVLETAVACARKGRIVWTASEEASLTMRDFSDAALEAYLAKIGDDAMTSVGGYKIEGPGVQLFSHIEGDFFVILGLPLLSLLRFLREQRVIPV